MVELMDDLEKDMPKWVEEMKEVPVESVDWAMCARLRGRDLTHGWISKIRSRLWHVELRTELRSRLRPRHPLRLPNCRLHGPTPSRKERQLLSYWLGRSARISSVASRHGGSGAVRLCHECAGRFVLVAEKLTAIQWD